MTPRTTPALLLSLAALVAAPSAAHAALSFKEFDFPAGTDFAASGRITMGSDGNMWVAIVNGGDVARIKPDGTIDDFDVNNITGVDGITSGPDGDIWVTNSGNIGHFKPTAPTTSGVDIPVTGVDGRELTFDTQHRVWTSTANGAVRINMDGTGKQDFPVTGGLSSRGVATGTDGNIYFIDFGGSLVKVTPTGTVTTTALVDSHGNAVDGTQGIAAGPQNQLAFTAPSGGTERLGLLMPAAAAPADQVKVLDADPDHFDPFGAIYNSLDQNYWIADFQGFDFTLLTPAGVRSYVGKGQLTGGVKYLAAGPNGTVWATEEVTKKIVRVSGVTAPPPPTTTTTTTTTTTPPPTTTTTGTTPPPPPVALKISSLTAPSKVTHGKTATFSVALTTAAKLKVTVAVKSVGRKVGKSCVARTHGNAHRAVCTRYVTRFTKAVSAPAGATKLQFKTKVNGKNLAKGSYRVTVVATGTTGAPVTKTASFKIV